MLNKEMKDMKNTKYTLTQYKDVKEEDIIFVDASISDADKVAFLVGLNLRVIKEEDFLWFGTKDCFLYTNPNEWVIKKEVSNK